MPSAGSPGARAVGYDVFAVGPFAGAVHLIGQGLEATSEIIRIRSADASDARVRAIALANSLTDRMIAPNEAEGNT